MAWSAPVELNYSGRVVDGVGEPVSGSQQVTLSLYDAVADGNLVWTRTYDVDLAAGYYSLTLAAGTPALDSALFDGGGLWLQTQVGTGAPLTPRQALSSVPFALNADRAQTVVVASTDLTGSCASGTVGYDASSGALGVCVDGGWTASAALGTALHPAVSCQQIADAQTNPPDALYWIEPNPNDVYPAMPMYCDFRADGAWTLVYTMCQDATTTIQSMPLGGVVEPDPAVTPASLGYHRVAALAPSTVRFTSTFNSGSQYDFAWSTAVSGVNLMDELLQGTTDHTNVSIAMGTPLPSSAGVSCSMYWEHNNNGSETHDIPTLGCSGTVWNSDGMLWGQIDQLTQYNGVSHLSATGWNHSPQTANGCIEAYVR